MKRSTRIFLYIIFGIVFTIGIRIIYCSIYRPNTHRIERPASEPKFRKDGQLTFISPDQDTLNTINIEIVEETEDIIRGMMYRNTLHENSGMFFVFPYEEKHDFWMKNTKISLDILFINKDYEIVTIADHRVPYSTDPIPSVLPIQYVVEVNAGFCKRNSITTGHTIHYFRD